MNPVGLPISSLPIANFQFELAYLKRFALFVDQTKVSFWTIPANAEKPSTWLVDGLCKSS